MLSKQWHENKTMVSPKQAGNEPTEPYLTKSNLNGLKDKYDQGQIIGGREEQMGAKNLSSALKNIHLTQPMVKILTKSVVKILTKSA